MAMSVHYVQLPHGTEPPENVVDTPFQAIVIAEEAVSPEWRASISAWLVKAGCLYMCAWGTDCPDWDASVDEANIEANRGVEILEDKFVMTTWHESESLSEAFWFAKNCANHPKVSIHKTLLVHVAQVNRENELLASFAEA